MTTDTTTASTGRHTLTGFLAVVATAALEMAGVPTEASIPLGAAIAGVVGGLFRRFLVR
jgi:hypothetical protein